MGFLKKYLFAILIVYGQLVQSSEFVSSLIDQSNSLSRMYVEELSAIIVENACKTPLNMAHIPVFSDNFYRAKKNSLQSLKDNLLSALENYTNVSGISRLATAGAVGTPYAVTNLVFVISGPAGWIVALPMAAAGIAALQFSETHITSIDLLMRPIQKTLAYKSCDLFSLKEYANALKDEVFEDLDSDLFVAKNQVAMGWPLKKRLAILAAATAVQLAVEEKELANSLTIYSKNLETDLARYSLLSLQCDESHMDKKYDQVNSYPYRIEFGQKGGPQYKVIVSPTEKFGIYRAQISDEDGSRSATFVKQLVCHLRVAYGMKNN